MFFETNTCVLQVSSVLSSGVVPARNRVLYQITNSRKLPPPARFILPGAVFHWERQPCKRALMEKISGNFSSYLLPAFYLCIFVHA
ncbi:MAG: hypothetical protein B7X86_08435 [Sphingobacteriales bacterium 17-39-43]|nr:MAG: hypothetical protein B7Y24_03450 [Sphingobacteriales bacterium 16-39-50]OZA24428.1 MAG: hypothetical protein B7X86_08435 [Sphingobacteriales bacterium 17-39-43]